MEQQLQNALNLLIKITGKTKKELETSIATSEAVASFAVEDDYKLGQDDMERSIKTNVLKVLKRNGIELADFKKWDEVVKAVLAKVPAKADDDTDDDQDPKAPKAKADQNEIDKLVKAHKLEIAKLNQEHADKLAEVENQSKSKVDKINRESLIKDYLKEGGFAVPKDAAQAELKLKMALGTIEGSNWVWDETVKDFVKADEDGSPVREKNKLVTLKDNSLGVFEASHGRTASNPKDGGTIVQPEPGQGGGVFEFKVYKGSLPKDLTEYNKLLLDPVRPHPEKVELREYWTQKAAAEKQTTA